jgi:two-component system nitrogen regulation sensor histidine kinase NtrY
MVDEFSAFARMPQPVIRPEDLSRIVREALVLPRAAHPQIGYTTVLPEGDGPVVRCDRRLIGQALTNLLQNAADAVAMRAVADGSSGGRIEVDVALAPGEVAVTVSDDGAGLPQQDRARLTEPYVTHKPKGTGLGLAIVKKIMEDHGGRLVLEDRPPRTDWEGSGAAATLVLPIRTNDGA